MTCENGLNDLRASDRAIVVYDVYIDTIIILHTK